MRYRKLSPDGDYLFGQVGSFLVDTPEAVAQAIQTRLLLWTGEWFLDSQEGTPYETAILGYGTQGSRDSAIKQRILGTPGVSQILNYSSNVQDRKLSVACTVETIYGANASIAINLAG